VYAKIATHVEQVVDIFYVRSLFGGKVDNPEDLDAIKTAVLGAISQSDGPGE
jgi:[protein-PII] uridylyltransferase